LPLVAIHTTQNLPANDPENGRQEERVITVDSAILQGLRILVVDDESDTRDMVKVVLMQYGAEVITAASAREAFETLPEFKPDVLVSDIGMPEEDGHSLIRK